MKRLVVTRSPAGDGELTVWEQPQEHCEYIAGCDPSLGRLWSEDADHSHIAIFKRLMGKQLEQVAEWHGRWPIGRVGEVLACLGRYWGSYTSVKDGRITEINNALVNVERNLMDSVKYGLVETQNYPETSLFVPRDARHILPGQPKIYFTNKDHSSQHYIINTLIDYFDRHALHLRSKATLDELRSLEKNDRGDVMTRGKDRSVAVMMACVADHESPPAADNSAEQKQTMPYDPPIGIDPVLYRLKYGIPTRKQEQTALQASGWEKVPAGSDWRSS